jgi:hypothetical protein
MVGGVPVHREVIAGPGRGRRGCDRWRRGRVGAVAELGIAVARRVGWVVGSGAARLCRCWQLGRAARVLDSEGENARFPSRYKNGDENAGHGCSDQLTFAHPLN